VVSPGPVTGVHALAGRLFRMGAGLVLLDTVGPLGQYSVTSVPETTDPGALQAAHGPDLRDQRWTQLPTTVPLRVRQLAATVVAGAQTRYDAVNAVERYLRSNETYRLDSPVPAPGEDPVDDFLFNSHQGFCEQFASAEVVLLRSRGIPARLVSGFAGGDASPSGFRVMKASDAHAWVEVWYPGLGWSSSDPTAGARLAPPTQPSLVGRFVQSVTSLAATAGGRIVLAALVLTLAALTVGIARLLAARRRRRTDRGTPPGRRPPGPVLAAFLRLDEALAAAGSPGSPAETLAEYAHRLPPRGRPALQVLEREVYGPAPPDPEQSREAVRVLDELRADLLAAGSRR
jgi:protein-glutamine gamma-glutamyltransferase